jgi:uncharacterized protein YkwD
MSGSHRWQMILAACATALAVTACGGGSSTSATTTQPANVVTTDPSAPTLTNNIAVDGRNWINYRRSQIGVPQLAQNSLIDTAAQNHSNYQKYNNTITHEETAGLQGFTGVTLLDRLTAAKYAFANTNHAYGEVISATSNGSGFYMAEELITAIYHRFVIFEPVFKEIGTGWATTSANYTYFTADFTSNNGYGTGVGAGNIVSWPFNGQTGVPANFFSDYESPDPVAGKNEVGYPISVHANIDATLTVQSFTVRPHGGADLEVKLLSAATDGPETPNSAAAIVPLSPLAAATTYDASFTGTVNGQAVTRNWSFTTK